MSGTPEERFAAKYTVDDSGCWLWTGATNGKGYGVFRSGGKLVLAHRWAYEHFVGPIPEGKVSDHLCRNHGCVNPEHLEPVTQSENVLRGDGPSILSARNSNADTCRSGRHNWEESRVWNGRQWRCQPCHLETTKQGKEKVDVR